LQKSQLRFCKQLLMSYNSSHVSLPPKVNTPPTNAGLILLPFPGASAMDDADNAKTSLSLLKRLRGPENERAWQDFCERYMPLMLGWCSRRGLQSADAEDVSQRVLEALFKRIDSYDPSKAPFRGWLKAVVENAIKDFLRARDRHPGAQGSGDSNIAAFLLAYAERRTLDGLVEELDSTLRRDLDRVRRDLEEILSRVTASFSPASVEAFRLVELEGQEIADVAKQLGKSYAATCQAIYRVKTKVGEEGANFSKKTQPLKRTHHEMP
jgi:RNA polymerase sigma-70 factor, ECF subfamily